MIDTFPKSFSEKINFTDECWLWVAALGRGGYGQYKTNGVQGVAHRFAWRHFKGEIPDGMLVLHKCDTPACVNPEHLFLGTQKDNMRDMIAKGRKVNAYGERSGSYTHPERIARGEMQGSSKLTTKEVCEIRNLYKKGSGGEHSQNGLAEKYGVCRTLISLIVNKKRWAHI